MDLYQLRYFLEVAREKNFTRAAAALGVSPPAVSQSIALLERSLGKSLFHRTRRRVALTAEGEALQVRVARAFDELELGRMEATGKAPARWDMIRIGSREMVSHYLLPQALREAKQAHPKTRFGLYELDPKEMAAALKNDRIEFAFHYSADIQDSELAVEHVGGLRSHVYCSKKLLGRSPVPKTFAQVCRLPFIAPRYFNADPSLPSMDGFPDDRYRRNIQYEGEFLETHRRFVLDGLCAAVLPDFVVADSLKRGHVLQLKSPPLGREIYFLHRKGRPLPEIASQIRTAIAHQLKNLK